MLRVNVLVSVLVLLVQVFDAQCASSTCNKLPHTVSIEVLRPRGIRVSLPHDQQISKFTFNGQIMKNYRNAPIILLSKTVTSRTGNHWVFEDRDVYLENGDSIVYEMFVQRGSVGCHLINMQYNVSGLAPDQVVYVQPEPTTISPGKLKTTTRPPTTSTINNVGTTMDEELRDKYERLIYNMSRALIEVHAQLNYAKAENEFLTNMVEKCPEPRTLVVKGSLPFPDQEDARSTIKFLLHEKLDLDPEITYVARTDHNAITFKVKTLKEKLQILYVAKDKLKNTRLDIIY